MNSPLTPSGPACSRREFVGALAAATALPLVAMPRARASEVKPAAGEARSPDRGAASPTCVHVFSKPLTWLSYAETATLVAGAGFGGIDYSVRPGGHVVPERVAEDLPRAVEAAHAAGLKVEMITTGILRADDTFTEPVLRTAAKLGVKYYRMGWMNYDFGAGVWATIEKLKPVMRDLAALNQQLGLHGAYQNHSGLHVGGAGWDLHELLRDLDPRWIGCQYDIRHATTEGGQSWPVTLRLLSPWIRCMDVKDFRWAQSPGKAKVEGVPLGEGIVDFAQFFPLVRELGIGGPMSVHLEYPPFEPAPKDVAPAERMKLLAAGLKKDRETLRRMMGA